ncbi:MAG TPA: ArsC/Spx/MgsR family protein [Legionellaceae bacterium]|nr:ArsC/Spx/MgsR family protein [Legionellaceae bacterium]
MNPFTIYHNPRCSKSREALEMLHRHQLHPIIIEYLKTPLNLKQIMHLRQHFELKDFVRSNEPVFKALKLTLDNEVEVLHAMVKEPILMQRPIITYGEKAVIARPIEKILEFIHHNLKT